MVKRPASFESQMALVSLNKSEVVGSFVGQERRRFGPRTSILRTALMGSVLALGVACSSGDATPSGGDPTNPGATVVAKDAVALTPGLAVSAVAVFQAVKVPIVKDGARIATKLPIIAGRKGVIRVYVTPDATFAAGTVTGTLKLNTGGIEQAPIVITRDVSGPSIESDASTCFDFPVADASLAEDTTFTIALTSPDLPRIALSDVPAQSSARYPQTGEPDALGATAASASLKIVVVPVAYKADNSGRVPDTSAARLEVYAQTVRSLYPVANVNISVHAPLAWSSTIAGNGGGWDTILNAMVNLRAKDRVADDVYYYGLFMPTASFAAFCQQGCVTGLSGLAQDPTDPSVRASVGLGYATQATAGTMAHEVGHAHGRPHAPCGGAQGVDASYPYSQAAIGALGYNILTDEFLPSSYKDLMSYCDPTWISDYNYGKLFQRISTVNAGAQAYRMGNIAPQRFKLASVDGSGRVHNATDTELAWAPSGEQKTVSLRAKNGAVTTQTARFYPYDHIPGGMLFLPAGEEFESATVAGITNQVTELH